jgi:hypothetical protein
MPCGERGMTLGLRPLNPWQGRDGPHSEQACSSITAAAVCPSNTADQLRSSVACAGFVSCIRLFGGTVLHALRRHASHLSTPQ